MRWGTKLVTVLFAFMVLALFSAGCTKSSSPPPAPPAVSSSLLSDEEAVKAIKSWIQASPMTALSPIEILEKSGPKQDGSYSYKVKFSASQFLNYKKRKKFIKTMTFTISKSPDNKGNSLWVAKGGK
jgi:nitrous oxide reductase accessory protein NosL